MNPFSMMMSGVGLVAGVIVFGVQLGGGFMMWSAASKMQESTANPLEKMVVEGEIKRGRLYLDEYKVLGSPMEFHKERYAVIVAYVPFRTILKGNQDVSANDETAVEIVSQVWVGDYALAECERLKKALASKCRVASVEASVREKRKVRIQMRLEYVAKQEAPVYDTAKKYFFNATHQELVSERKSGSVTWKSAESKRRTLYRKVAMLCSKIRKKYGNCESSGLSIYMETRRKKSSYGLSARATLSWLKENGAVEVASK